MPTGIANQTPAQRTENLAKARIARAVKNEARCTSTLRRDFADAEHWSRLAKRLKVRLPAWGEPCTPSTMRRFLTKCGWTVAHYAELTNEPKLAIFPSRNPEWGARPWAGIVLEMVARERGVVLRDAEVGE